jgi:glutaredoxin-related protein
MGIWKSDWQTVPQLWLRGEHIGGYTDYVNRSIYAQTPPQECEACHA